MKLPEGKHFFVMPPSSPDDKYGLYEKGGSIVCAITDRSDLESILSAFDHEREMSINGDYCRHEHR